jgi:hypothetical protein
MGCASSKGKVEPDKRKERESSVEETKIKPTILLFVVKEEQSELEQSFVPSKKGSFVSYSLRIYEKKLSEDYSEN